MTNRPIVPIITHMQVHVHVYPDGDREFQTLCQQVLSSQNSHMHANTLKTFTPMSQCCTLKLFLSAAKSRVGGEKLRGEGTHFFTRISMTLSHPTTPPHKFKISPYLILFNGVITCHGRLQLPDSGLQLSATVEDRLARE